MVNSALLVKALGGGVAATGATGVGIYYKDTIYKFFAGSEQDNNILLTVSSTVTAPSDAELFNTVDGKEQKNYTCQIATTQYECDLVKEITPETTKKWTKVDINTAPKTALKNNAKTNLAAQNKFFVIKVSNEMLKAITWTDAQEIQIVDVKTKTKIFSKLKVLSGKKGDEILGNVKYFLSKVINTGEASNGEYTVESSKTYKCEFSDITKTKACDIYKFADSQTPAKDTDFSQINFTGKLADADKVTANAKIKQYEYYVISFTTDVKNSDFGKKDSIFLTVDGSNPAKNLQFSPIIPVIKTGSDNAFNLFIL